MLNESSSKSIFNNRKTPHLQMETQSTQKHYQQLSTEGKILFAQSQVEALKEQLLNSNLQAIPKQLYKQDSQKNAAV